MFSSYLGLVDDIIEVTEADCKAQQFNAILNEKYPNAEHKAPHIWHGIYDLLTNCLTLKLPIDQNCINEVSNLIIFLAFGSALISLGLTIYSDIWRIGVSMQ